MSIQTRDDFLENEDYLRYLHESGFSPVDEEGKAICDYSGEGHYARLLQGIWGAPAPRGG